MSEKSQLSLPMNYIVDRDNYIKKLFEKGTSKKDIARKVGCTRNVVWKRLRRMGLKSRHRDPSPQSDHKHGYTKTDKGYWKVSVPPSSPYRKYANKGGWQYVYRVAGCVYMGRRLKEYEHVHHLEGIDRETDGDYSIEQLVDMFEVRYEIMEDTLHGTYHYQHRPKGSTGVFIPVKKEPEKIPEQRDVGYPSDWDEIGE